MKFEDLTTLAKIIRDAARIRKESYDNSNLEIMAAAREATVLHAPELANVNLPDNMFSGPFNEDPVNALAYFIDLAMEQQNDLIAWADAVLKMGE